MAVCPFASWRPLPENTSAPTLEPRVAILHSAAVPVTSLYNAFNRAGNNLESHFFVKKNGVIEQYMDTERQADANYKANRFAVSIETEDNGNPNADPWTPAQLDSIFNLLGWLHSTHKIPMRRCNKWDGSGVGYHTMWGSPSQWTPVAKSCPGKIRIWQFEQKIIPTLASIGKTVTFTQYPPSDSFEVAGVQINIIPVRVALDAEGRGHTPQPLGYPFSKVLGYKANGPYPFTDGWNGNEKLTVTMQERDGGTHLNVVGGVPSSEALVFLTVAV